MSVLPKNDLLKQKILENIAQKFEKNRTYNEHEVNEIIKSISDDDSVLIRRELINFNYFKRDPYTGTYWLLKYKLSNQEIVKIAECYQQLQEIEKE